MKLNYGIIGTGMMGCEHIRNLKKIPDVKIVAIADPDERSRKWAEDTCGDAFKLKLYEDYRELLMQEDIDVVVVASPNFTHIEIMRELFKTDKHVLLEKPMCTNLLDAMEVLEKSKEHKGVVWVGLEYRFMSPIQSLINHMNENLKDNVFHCYNKKKQEIDVFLEDYAYYCLLLITLYEINNDKISLEKCEKKMEETWNLFFNKENNLLQKNIIKYNDLFVQPLDISDSNIPNGNSIYLLICSKLSNITNKKLWTEKLDILSKSFHTFVNYNFSQMFSYLKILDICEENISVTLYGKINEKLKNEILMKFMGNVSIVYKESEEEFFVVICKNQTCSEKLKDLIQINEYIKNNL